MSSFDDVEIQGGELSILNQKGDQVGMLRSSSAQALEDYPDDARFFGELEMSRPDIAKPTVRVSALGADITLGVTGEIDGTLRLYGKDLVGAGTLRMWGEKLLLSAGRVVASSIFECISLVGRRLSLRDDPGTTRFEWKSNTGISRAFDASKTLRYEFDSNTSRARFFDQNAILRYELDGNTSRARFFDSNGNNTMTLDGAVGDVVLNNADCAEEFPVHASAELPLPGSVVVLAEGGRVRMSSIAYDSRVAGVVSGAGSYRPGLILDRRPDEGDRRVPVALMGKVCCLVDATEHPVRAGDLLTTAAEAGHAARLMDGQGARGAVLGKALANLRGARGMLPILVTLQ